MPPAASGGNSPTSSPASAATMARGRGDCAWLHQCAGGACRIPGHAGAFSVRRPNAGRPPAWRRRPEVSPHLARSAGVIAITLAFAGCGLLIPGPQDLWLEALRIVDLADRPEVRGLRREGEPRPALLLSLSTSDYLRRLTTR